MSTTAQAQAGHPAPPAAAEVYYRDRSAFRPGESVPVVVDGRESGRVDDAYLLP